MSCQAPRLCDLNMRGVTILHPLVQWLNLVLFHWRLFSMLSTEQLISHVIYLVLNDNGFLKH